MVVGCGGLGCELLKLLSLDAANRITAIDDDTIDVTNLNRQFLFARPDVGKGKAAIAGQKLSSGAGAPITAMQERIDVHKRIAFYKKFDVVYNCLDNDEARSFVNQRCQLAGVRMIDGGSAGWLGQSFCSGEECFDCLPRKIARTYPVCTIRQRPQNFEHCLVWAKAVLDHEASLDDLDNFGADEGELCEHDQEDSGAIVVVESAPEDKNCAAQCSADVADMQEELLGAKNSIYEASARCQETDEEGSSGIVVIKEKAAAKDTDPRDEYECKRAKRSSECTKLLEHKTAEPKINEIYSMANKKAEQFGITPLSFVDSQTFLDMIVPSVCTTNAIVASLMVLSRHKKKNYFLVQNASRFVQMELIRRNRKCLTCSLPVYICRFTNGTAVRDLIHKFKGSAMITDTGLYDRTSDDLLDNRDGEFGIIIRNDCKYRFYFEKIEDAQPTLEFQRMK